MGSIVRVSVVGLVVLTSAAGCGESKRHVSESGGTGAVSAGRAGRGSGGTSGASGGSGGTAGSATTVGGAAGGGTTGGGTSGGGTSGGGTAGAGSAGEVGASECGSHDDLGPRLWASTQGSLGALDGTVYDGPAIVEGSTESSLVLSLGAPDASAGGAAGDGGGSTMSTPLLHMTLRGLNPMPLLEPGTKLWLTKNPAVLPQGGFFPGPGWSISPSRSPRRNVAVRLCA